jgi:hypothetical protein
MAAPAFVQKEARHYPTWDHKDEEVDFVVADSAASLRTYSQTTSSTLRDPGPATAQYSESADLPRVRSGSISFDALFALAAAEMRQNSVAHIRDGSYNGGAAIACDCFETGEKWHYVWTRDLSYAAHLGLALVDPQRVANSLAFKLSGYRSAVVKPLAAAGSSDGLQIIQDTGSGGSWPVSTDRISWAFGAAAALKTLPEPARTAFAATAYKALVNTVENDRLAAFDAADGLYRGEQSFLDWREQSYAGWLVDDIASLATSKALSTNVGHYQALNLTATLVREQSDEAAAQRYLAWAAALKVAINARFWQADTGLYSSITAGHFDGAALYKYDWLGLSLAIVTGVADAAQTTKILANYPHGPFGAPVIFPQQPGVAAYHNRALWPFVSAFGLQAAIKGRNVSVADAAYDSLMRGAALNLSNMENLEWLSGQPMLQDAKQPQMSGPVINSKRQLWSVGAYLGMVIEDVFGIRTTTEGLRIEPFITAKMQREAFGSARRIVLQDLRIKDRTLTVEIALPSATKASGYFNVQQIELNGKPSTASVPWSALAQSTHIRIRLGALQPGRQEIRRVDGDPLAQDRSLFAPYEPTLKVSSGATAEIVDLKNSPATTRYNIYRNGRMVDRNLPAGVWSDSVAHVDAVPSCYAVEAVFLDSGNRSHHSAPLCMAGTQSIGVQDVRLVASRPISAPGSVRPQAVLADWGNPSDTFSLRDVQVSQAGLVHVQLAYYNDHHAINLGISGGVKWLSLSDQDGRMVAAGVISMPHADPRNGPAYSTPLSVQLAPGRYRLQLQDFTNMSYLQSNASYADAGGIGGPVNRFDIVGVRIFSASPLPAQEK